MIICFIKNTMAPEKYCPAHIFVSSSNGAFTFFVEDYSYLVLGVKPALKKFVIILLYCRMDFFVTLHTSSAFSYHLVCISSNYLLYSKWDCVFSVPGKKSTIFGICNAAQTSHRSLWLYCPTGAQTSSVIVIFKQLNNLYLCTVLLLLRKYLFFPVFFLSKYIYRMRGWGAA
jgi:hypothetical protein